MSNFIHTTSAGKPALDLSLHVVRIGGRTAFGLRASLVTSAMCLVALPCAAMDMQTALETAMATNPEIAEAAANRRAIDFEYEQARYLNRPSLLLDARIGPELVDSRTTRVLGTDDRALFGRQASATLQQNLFSFGRHDAEQDRQAARVDAAAMRVEERSEFVALDVIQAYLDISRIRDVLAVSDENVAFNQAKVDQLGRGVSAGVTGSADARQAEERLSAALVVRSETEEALDFAEASFMRLVGQPIGQTQMPRSIAGQVPQSLQDALAQARRNNPTLRIAHSDLDTSRANYRKAKAELKPEILFELVGRAGEDIGGFEDNNNDVRAQLRFRHEFRGGIKSAAVQEQLNRVDEARARIMSLERNVDQVVREAWSTRTRTRARVANLERQVAQGTELLDSYQREFAVNRRTLLDILDAENSLFQAKSALATARYSDIFAQYRLLAATGSLLDTLGLQPLREASTGLRELEKVPPTPPADTEPRRYPDHMDDVDGAAAASLAAAPAPMSESDFAAVDVVPVIRQSPSPAQALSAMAAIDAYVDDAVGIQPLPAAPVRIASVDGALPVDSAAVESIAAVTHTETPAPVRVKSTVAEPVAELAPAPNVPMTRAPEGGMLVQSISAADFALIKENPKATLLPDGNSLVLDHTIYLKR